MTLLSTLSRHPRYILAVGLAVILSTIFLVPHSSYRSVDASEYFKFRQSNSSYLPDILAQQETYYKTHLERREALVRRYGPTVDKIESFPLHGEFYTLWDFFIPAFQCPHRMERIGNLGDGGKWVCGMDRIAKQKECVIYAFGLNGEVSFEADLLQRAPGCQMWGYDFSVNSVGPEIENAVDKNKRPLSERAHFRSVGLAGHDAHDASPPMYTLQTLMEVNEHKFIDLLKIDVEESEFAALEAFLAPYLRSGAALPIGQMQIEIHATPSVEYSKFPKFKAWWEKLEAAGLRPFWTEPNLVYVNIVKGVRPDLAEYSFMNIRGEHALVSDKWLQ